MHVVTDFRTRLRATAKYCDGTVKEIRSVHWTSTGS